MSEGNSYSLGPLPLLFTSTLETNFRNCPQNLFTDQSLCLGLCSLAYSSKLVVRSEIIKIIDYCQSLPRPLKGGFVFSKRRFNRRAYDKAVEVSCLGDFTFHDLRHCAINNLRLAGNDHFAIKKISGHKTDSAFQRYNLVTEEEMKGMKWLEEKGDNFGMMDTYMDTKP